MWTPLYRNTRSEVACGSTVISCYTVFPPIVRALRIDRVGCLERAKYSAPSKRVRSIIKAYIITQSEQDQAKCCLVGHILRNHQALLHHEGFQKLALLP